MFFYVSSFIPGAFNTKVQLIQFFDFRTDFALTSLSFIMTVLAMAIGLFTINLLFTFIHLAQEVSLEQISKRTRGKGLFNCCKFFIRNFWSILRDNFEIESRLEMYPQIFLLVLLIFLPFLKGNPILNNYYGIYKEYEVEYQNRDGAVFDRIENKNYVIHKSKIKQIRSLENGTSEGELYFEVKKRGYLFLQAAIIDGYKTYYREYKGFLSYIECLFFSLLEKFINTIMYFFIPFITLISFYHYKFEQRSVTKP